MRAQLLAFIGLLQLPLAPGASAQLLSERVDGLARICTYAGAGNIISGAAGRQLRVGLGQNCPYAYVQPTPNVFPMPPTALLRGELLGETARTCTYAQADSTWTLTVPRNQTCPPFAGMTVQGGSRPPSPAEVPQATTPDTPQSNR